MPSRTPTPDHDRLRHRSQAVDALLLCNHPLRQVLLLLMTTSLFPPALPRLPEAATGRNRHGTAVARATLRINETTFLILPILSAHHRMAQIAAGSRSTRQPSSATYVQSVSLERTTFALIFAHIQTNDLSFARFVVRRSRASTIASATKVCIRARRSSFAEETCRLVQVGVAGVGSLVRTLWVDTLDLKLDESASNLCLMRKPPRDGKPGLKSSNRHKLPQAWWRRRPQALSQIST